MPTKHINISESLLGLGTFVLGILNKPKTIDAIWLRYRKDFDNGLYFSKHSFDNLILTIIFLYSIDVIVEKNGEITRCV